MVKYESQLDSVFAALAHPARRAMLARLGRGDATVGELARPLEMSLPAVTKHLKVLEKAEPISRGKNAQWRPCQLQEAPLKTASRWNRATAEGLGGPLGPLGATSAQHGKRERRRR